MTIREFKALAAEKLSAVYPQDECAAAARALLAARLNVPDYKIASEPSMAIGAEAQARLDQDIATLAEGCPLQYVLGSVSFAGIRLKVGPGCLIPRPETEEMVAKIVDEFSSVELEEDRQFNILDLCTGSGCIAYALAAEFPEAQIFACDFSDAALRIACRQRVKLDGAKPVFFQADILQEPPAGLPKFDLIVSNPPYVMDSERAQMRRNVLDYEPAEALFVPDDDALRFYKAIRRWAEKMLAPDGVIWMEINEKLGAETAGLFSNASVIKDLFGKDRFVRATL